MKSSIKALLISASIVTTSLVGINAHAQSNPSVGEQPPPAYNGAPPIRGSHPRGEQMMKRIDSDKDGQISRAELQASQQRQLEMFDKADTNKDGKLSAEERRTFYDAMRAGHRLPRNAG